MALSFYFLSITMVESYYLSLNTFEFQTAEIYCQQHCGSHLASLHSIDDYNSVKYLIINATFDSLMSIIPDGDDERWTWIGLNHLETAYSFKWTDGSKFDFLNDTMGLPLPQSYPWGDDEPGSQRCIFIQGSNNAEPYLLNDGHCRSTSDISRIKDNIMFACNHCHGKLTKYVILDDNLDEFSVLHQDCMNRFGTGLASIHNDMDYMDTKRLCNVSSTQRTADTGSNQGCWIGLYDYDYISSSGVHGNFTWLDGTTFDYGVNISGGMYPWAGPREPDGNSDAQCTELRNVVGWSWADSTCYNARKGICNMPSEICYQDRWTVISGNDGVWNTKPCQLSLEYNEIYQMIMGNRRWYNGDQPLVIELMYSIRDYSEGSVAGIILHDGNKCDGYKLFGIDPIGNKAVILTNVDGVQFDNTLVSDYDEGIFYALKLEMDPLTNLVNLYINNAPTLVFNLDMISLTNGLSPYIGIISIKSSIVVKSLFISGQVIHVSHGPVDILSWFDQCSELPTTATPSLYPSSTTTATPSISPTAEALQCDVDTATFTLAFDFTSNNGVSRIHLLQNITYAFNEEIFEQIQCKILQNATHIIVNDQLTRAEVNVAICFQCDELNANINDDMLENDFIDKIEDSGVLTVDKNSSNLEIDIVRDGEGIIPSTTRYNVVVTQSQQQSDDGVSEILYGVIALLSVCCCALGIIVHRRIKRPNHVKESADNEAENIKLSSETKTANISGLSIAEELQGDAKEGGSQDEEIYLKKILTGNKGTKRATTDGNDIEQEHVSEDINEEDIKMESGIAMASIIVTDGNGSVQ